MTLEFGILGGLVLKISPKLAFLQLVCDEWSDGRRDRGMDGRTHPRIEMPERIQKWHIIVRESIKEMVGMLIEKKNRMESTVAQNSLE